MAFSVIPQNRIHSALKRSDNYLISGHSGASQRCIHDRRQGAIKPCRRVDGLSRQRTSPIRRWPGWPGSAARDERSDRSEMRRDDSRVGLVPSTWFLLVRCRNGGLARTAPQRARLVSPAFAVGRRNVDLVH